MYNVKLITYPDLTKQVRVYDKPIVTDFKRPVYVKPIPELDPFNQLPVRSLEAVERSQDTSRKRAIDMIHRYARCNIWEWFVTFTFAPEKVDRYDYEACTKKLSMWLNNIKKTYCPNMCYIIVPELHKDGAYHFHGLFSHCSGMDIRDSGKKVIKRYQKGNRTFFRRTDEVIYLFGRYRLGWMTATKVKSNDRVIKYLTKYVTKELVTGTKNKRRYWVSKNLELPEEELMLFEADMRWSLMHDLEEDSKFTKHIACKEIKQMLHVYELD